MSDCRTSVRADAYCKKRPDQNRFSLSDGKPAISIFEHRRNSKTGRREIPPPIIPTSFGQVLAWLDGRLEAARTTKPPTSADAHDSSVCLIFLDQKRASTMFNEDRAMAKLNAKLRAEDWSPTHYMTAFCRFPTPLEDDLQEQEASSRLWTYRYSISHPFYWDMLWAYLPATKTSIGLVRTWIEGYSAGFADLERAVLALPGPTLDHPLLLGVLALQVLASDAMDEVCNKGIVLYEAQRLTGLHDYDYLRETDAAVLGVTVVGGDLAGTTKRILGASANLTGWQHATDQMEAFARFLAAEIRAFDESMATVAGPFPVAIKSFRPAASGVEPMTTSHDGQQRQQGQQQTHDNPRARLGSYLSQQSSKAGGDVAGASHDAQAWLATAQLVLQGVLNLLSQHDATLNLHMAQSNNVIAEKSKRDSTSMVAIALVTMSFLPGMFTASFFAMPFFESASFTPSSSSSDSPSNPGQGLTMTHFWIYWAVTVPLTILVLVAWVLWAKLVNPPAERARRQLLEGKRLAEAAEHAAVSSGSESESGSRSWLASEEPPRVKLRWTVPFSAASLSNKK